MKTRLATTFSRRALLAVVATLSASAALLSAPSAGAAVHDRVDPYSRGQVAKADPYTNGAAKKVDPYTDGAAGKTDPYTDGAAKKAAPYTDGALAKVAPYTDGAARKADPYTQGGVRQAESEGLLSWNRDTTYPHDTSRG